MKKILVVDDSNEISSLIKDFLSIHFDVTVCGNGLQAFDSLQGGYVPDLIVSDIQMPDMDGYDFVNQLKMSGVFASIPVVMLSSLDDSSERVKFLGMGVKDYLVKPFNPEELLLRIQNVLKMQ